MLFWSVCAANGLTWTLLDNQTQSCHVSGSRYRDNTGEGTNSSSASTIMIANVAATKSSRIRSASGTATKTFMEGECVGFGEGVSVLCLMLSSISIDSADEADDMQSTYSMYVDG